MKEYESPKALFLKLENDILTASGDVPPEGCACITRDNITQKCKQIEALTALDTLEARP